MNRKTIQAVTGCLVVQICVGIVYLWSALKGSVVATYGEAQGWTMGAANQVASIMLFSFVFGGLIGGFLNDKKGSRLTCFAGVGLFSAGIALAAFAHSVTAFTFTYAIMAGLGSGFAYVACIACVQKWLPHRRGLAAGLATTAFGLSTVVFAPIVSWLVNIYRDANGIVDFVPVFLILAAVFATLGFLGCTQVSLPSAEYIASLNLPKKTVISNVNYTLSEAIRTKAFWALFFSIFLINGTWNLCVPLIKDLGIVRGLTETVAIACVSFTGITNAAGRLFMSMLSDRIGRTKTMYILSLLTVLGAILLTFITGSGYFTAIALVAFAYGGPAPIFAALCTDLFGPKNAGTNYGVCLLALGLSAIIFNLLSTYVLHSTVQNMTATFIMGAVTAAIPILLMIYINNYLKNRAQAN